MSDSKIINFYDDYSTQQVELGINERQHAILNGIKKIALSQQSSLNILEIGCGIGTMTELLATNFQKSKIIALDISPVSIEIAKVKYKENKNISFYVADVCEFDFKNQIFDIIVLPDVIEHIPIEDHSILFKKLEQILNLNGFIYINIPNPYYLEWVHENRPELLQVIDQPLFLDKLVPDIYNNKLHIHTLETYSIWVKDSDYLKIILKKNNFQDFNINLKTKTSFFQKVKGKIKSLQK